MINFKPFKAGHLAYLRPQAMQKAEHTLLASSEHASVLEGHLSLTAWEGTRCIGAAGLIHVRPHRALAWAILGATAGRNMYPIAKKIRAVIKGSNYARVEFTVAEGFEPGFRFAKLIGARRETEKPMRFYGTTGGSEYMYAVIKDLPHG